MLFAQILTVILGTFPPNLALHCKHDAIDLRPVGCTDELVDHAETEYNCPTTDSHCVSLDGVLRASPKNLSFAYRSCLSDASAYLRDYEAKVGHKLPPLSCNRNASKRHSDGLLSYWYSCCSTDNCNTEMGNVVHSGTRTPKGLFQLFLPLALIALIFEV